MAASHLPSVLKWLRHEGLVKSASLRAQNRILRGIEEAPLTRRGLGAGVNGGLVRYSIQLAKFVFGRTKRNVVIFFGDIKNLSLDNAES